LFDADSDAGFLRGRAQRGGQAACVRHHGVRYRRVPGMYVRSTFSTNSTSSGRSATPAVSPVSRDRCQPLIGYAQAKCLPNILRAGLLTPIKDIR
jgi:hypothetical protein